MPIIQTTPDQEIANFLSEQIKRREAAIIYNLEYIGTACINEARTNGSYQDKTGALRNSIGYLVLNNGVQVSFNTESGPGEAQAKEQLLKLAARFPHGIVLIVVAGMNYASSVEAKNYNVLASAELLAEKLVPEILKDLGFTKL